MAASVSDEIGAQIDSSQTPKKDGGEIFYVHCDLREEENIKVKYLGCILPAQV